MDGRALQAEEELNRLRQKVKDMQEEMQQNERSLKAEVRSSLVCLLGCSVFILKVTSLPCVLVNVFLSNVSAFRLLFRKRKPMKTG